MANILTVSGVFWQSEPIVCELTSGEILKNVKYGIEKAFQHQSGKVYSLKRSLSSTSNSILAKKNNEVIQVDLDRPIKTYIYQKNLKDKNKYIDLIFSFSLGMPPLKLGENPFLDYLDINDTIIQSKIPPNFADRLALVLSGGGAKGAAQAGAIKAINDIFLNINSRTNIGSRIHYVVGSSIGAFNSLFVSSNKIDKLEKFWRNVNPLTGLQLIRVLKKEIKETDLKIPLEVTKVNLQTGKVEYSEPNTSDIYSEVKKSMCLPPIFPAVKFGGYQYIDGGTITNLPISRCLDKKCYWIIVLSLEKERSKKKKYWWPFGQATRAIELQGNELHRYQRLLLLIGSYMKKLIDKVDIGSACVDELIFINTIKKYLFTSNIIVVPLKNYIKSSTIWFSRKKCNRDFDVAYDKTYKYLKLHLEPLVRKFEQDHPVKRTN